MREPTHTPHSTNINIMQALNTKFAQKWMFFHYSTDVASSVQVCSLFEIFAKAAVPSNFQSQGGVRVVYKTEL